jgi:hypothetical protein
MVALSIPLPPHVPHSSSSGLPPSPSHAGARDKVDIIPAQPEEFPASEAEAERQDVQGV